MRDEGRLKFYQHPGIMDMTLQHTGTWVHKNWGLAMDLIQDFLHVWFGTYRPESWAAGLQNWTCSYLQGHFQSQMK